MAIFTAADADALLASIAPSLDVVIPATNGAGVPYTEIEANAFISKGITSVMIPNSVNTIGVNAFNQNPTLQYVVVPAKGPDFSNLALSSGQVVTSFEPTGIEFSPSTPATVDENVSPGTIVAQINAIDQDAPFTLGADFVYELVDGVGSEDNASFKIIGNLLLGFRVT